MNGVSVRGRVLYVSGDIAYAAKSYGIYKSMDGGESWFHLCSLPLGALLKLVSFCNLARRFLRKEISHIIEVNGVLIVFGYGKIFRFSVSEEKWIGTPVAVNGLRPLNLCVKGGIVYYGEYRRNAERSPIHIYASSDTGATWESVYEFKDVRHIHGVFCDPYTGIFWITTGDDDSECGIWNTGDNFGTVNKVFFGTQMCRAVTLLFTEKYILYASDSPVESNFVFRFTRDGLKTEKLVPVISSVFYGAVYKDNIFFSTACEPSVVNAMDRSEVVVSSDGGDSWFSFFELKKDPLSIKLFQYGNVLFPYRENSTDALWYSPVAVHGDHKSFRLD